MYCPPVVRAAILLSRDIMVQKSKDGNMTLRGFEGIFLDTILRALHRKFELVIADDNELGRLLPNGSWTGMIGLIQKGRADIAYNCLGITEDRVKVVDFSTVYEISKVTFAIKKLGMFTTPRAFIYSFDSTVWIITLLTLLIMPITFKLVLQVKETYFHLLIKLLQAILGKSLNIKEDSWKCRILINSWNIFSFIMAFCYTTALFSILTVPTEISTVKNFVELSNAVSKRGFKLLIAKGSATLNLLTHSEKKHLKLIGESISSHKWYMDIQTPLLTTPQIDTDSALLGLQKNLQMIAGPEEWKHHFLSDDSINTFPIALAMKKNFCYKRKLNTIISRLNSAGLYQKITSDDHFRKWLSSSVKKRVVHRETQALSLELLSVAFVILSFGLISGLVALFCEIYVSKMLKNV
ncbi:hypothetical protein AVEN_60898-1 [Araneus ventricosus]|uniref:Ionotropic glutamate receptor L-glutamate and glycine-binding domain-containing protein n=1 Tax=Araneus ventricosus TaxID=182803 RepID=A0A4Y2X804_ARAVE|nr:hypothetical protein AVEN_60898-1 [Araneus ventricosus]